MGVERCWGELMASVDERPVAHGGAGASARSILAGQRGGFIERHALWGDRQYAAAAQAARVIDEAGIDQVRVSFVDQHGALRGKSLSREGLSGAFRDGIRAPSSLLLKDTSGRSVFPVFSADPGVGVSGFAGAADIVLVPDPTTFRPLPWSPQTACILCDLRFPTGAEVPFCTRSLLRQLLDATAIRGYDLRTGIELEFHVFRGEDGLGGREAWESGVPPPVLAPISREARLLHESDLDRLDDLVRALHNGLALLDLPLRSIELEFGASQLEVTLGARDALGAADDVVLCRAAIRQICRREGYCATFMARPAGERVASTGWHLHQALTRPEAEATAFAPSAGSGAAGAPGYGVLSATGGHYVAGLLAHARAAAVFTTPTVNGYKRYQPLSLAPERIVWGIDNRGAMIRAIGGRGDPATRIENRSGEPSANPYLYVASQLASGLDGVDRELDPGPPTDEPYVTDAERLPRSLAEALDALEGDPLFAASFGAEMVAWYSALKRAELDRYLAHVSDWEQHEYFDLV